MEKGLFIGSVANVITLTVVLLVSMQEALNLSVEAEYLTTDTVKLILLKAYAQSLTISNVVKERGYTVA